MIQKLLQRPLALAVAAQVILALAAIRHRYLWGGDLAPILNAGEGIALVAYTVLGAAAMLRAAALADRGELRVPTIASGAAILALIAALSPPIASTDVIDYVTRGRVEVLHGANPYTVAPENFPNDPITADSGDWSHLVLPYGPLQAVLQSAIAWVTAPFGRIEAGVLTFSLLFAACHLATGLVIGLALRSAAVPDREIRRTLVMWLWNPYILLETCSSAHNEALVALGLATCCLGIVRVRGLTVALSYGAAALVKHGIAPLGPLTLVWAARRKQLPGYLSGVAVAGVTTALFAWHYWFEPNGFDWLSKQAANLGASIQAAVVASLAGEENARTVLGVGQTLAALCVLGLATRVRDAATFGRYGAAATLLFILIGMPLFSVWYHLWWLPVLVACGSRPLAYRALGIVAITVPPAYLVFLTTRSYGAAHQVWTWLCAMAIPCAVLLPRLLSGDTATAEREHEIGSHA